MQFQYELVMETLHYIYWTSPPQAAATQGQFLRGFLTGLNSVFLFLYRLPYQD